MGVRKYTVSVISVSDAGSAVNNSNYIEFINQGNTIAVVQGVTLYPYQSWVPSENTDPNTIDTTNYIYTFNASGVASPVNNLLIIRKQYYT